MVSRSLDGELAGGGDARAGASRRARFLVARGRACARGARPGGSPRRETSRSPWTDPAANRVAKPGAALTAVDGVGRGARPGRERRGDAQRRASVLLGPLRDPAARSPGSRSSSASRLPEAANADAARAIPRRSARLRRDGLCSPEERPPDHVPPELASVVNGRIAMIDGQLLPLEQATVSVLDRGFLYGDSVFETLRTYGGGRLRSASTSSGSSVARRWFTSTLPVSLADAALTRSTRRCRGGKRRRATCASRSRAARASSVSTRALATSRLRVVIVTPLHAPPLEQYEQGIRVVTFRAARHGDGTAHRRREDRELSRQRARDAGARECWGEARR